MYVENLCSRVYSKVRDQPLYISFDPKVSVEKQRGAFLNPGKGLREREYFFSSVSISAVIRRLEKWTLTEAGEVMLIKVSLMTRFNPGKI